MPKHHNLFIPRLLSLIMASKEQMISGSGTNPREADTALDGDKRTLAAKLKEAGATTQLEVVRAHYSARYELKGDCSEGACARRAEYESPEGWAQINTKAHEAGVDGRRYGKSFKVEHYVTLTDEQKKALEPKRTPAGETGYVGPDEICSRIH